MKKLIITIAIFLTCLQSYSQSLLSINNLVNITLPVGAVSVTKSDAQGIINNIFNNSTAASIPLEDGYPYVYKIGNIAMRFHTNNRPVKAGFLQSQKSGLDKILTVRSGYYNSLINVNGRDVLLTKFTGGAVYDYSFICYNSSNTAMISGLIVFNKADEAQAKLVLNTILASIKFAGE